MKKLKQSIVLAIYFACTNTLIATTPDVKALYVEFFGNYILGNATLESQLISYAQTNGYNYLALYDMQNSVLDRDAVMTSFTSAKVNALENFIITAKTAIPTLEIGIVGGAQNTGATTTNFIWQNIDGYNASRSNVTNKCIDVLNLEFEYWDAFTFPTQQDREDAFTIYKTELDGMWTLRTNTTNHGLKVETYLGAMNNTISTIQDQADFIDARTDRVLLAVYTPDYWVQDAFVNAGYNNLFLSYDRTAGMHGPLPADQISRMDAFANVSNAKPTEILLIFSAESESDTPPCSVGQDNDFLGDYLWFNDILNNPTPGNAICSQPPVGQTLTHIFSHTGTTVNLYDDFWNHYQNSPDPYLHANNGNGWQNPCGTTPLEQCIGYEVTLRPYGNKIKGYIMFKYGLMPIKDNTTNLYLFGGADQTPIEFTPNPITITENLSPINTAASISLQVHDLNNCNLVSPSNGNYYWYRNGCYFAQGVSSISPSAPAAGLTDIYTCEVQTDKVPGQFLNYRIRDDIKVTGQSANGGSSYAVIRDQTPASCPSFSSGTTTVFAYDAGCSTCTYGQIQWKPTGGNTWTTVWGYVPYQITGLANGTYDIQVKLYVNWLTTSVEIYKVDDSPSPVVTAQNPFINCNLQLVTSQYSSYQWFKNGSLINGATNISYTANQDGNYKVSVTNSSGCTGVSKEYTIKQNPLATISGPTSTCNGMDYSVPFDNNGISCTWTVPPGATFINHNNSITVNWGNAQYSGGTISCTVTNACGNSASGSIDVLGCCNTPGYTQKNNVITTGSQIYCGQKLNINGVYRILNGHTITFDNCDIQFSNNARIEVDPGATLNIKSICTNANGIIRSHLYACGSGWTGIHLADNTSLLIIDNILIENAQDAIYSHNSGEFHITNSDFKNNTISIWVTDGNYSASTVSGNTFDCPTCGANTSGIVHVSAFHADGLTINANTLKNCDIGIHSDNRSNTHSLGNTFRGINIAGVLAENNGSIDVSSMNIFDNCIGGVGASNSVDVYVDGNSFSQGMIAVFTQLCANRRININNNNIVNPSWIGVAGLFNYPCNQSYYNNTISFSPNQNVYGIVVGESNLVQPGQRNLIDINGNHVFDAAFGINVSNDYNTLITENDIHFINHNTNKTYGILAQNSHYPIIEGNLVKDESQLKESQYGITVELGGGAILCSNTIDGMFQGIIFAGNMLGTNVQVILNVMENSDIGFVLRNGGDIGLQGDLNGIYYYNQWISNGYDSYSFGSNISNTSHFPVSTSNNTIPYIISTHGNDGQNGAYDILSPSSNVVSQYIVSCDGVIKDPTDDAKKIVNDMLNYTVDPDQTKWLSKTSVLDALKYKTDIDASDVDIQSFEASADNDAMGELRDLKESYADAFLDTTIVGGDSITIEQVKSANQLVSDQSQIESYQKTVNDIYLKTAAVNKNVFDQQQTETLQLIAALCPYEAGSAVYTAQLILFYKEKVFYNSSDCDDYSPMRFQHLVNKNSNGFVAYPNPTDSKLTFSYILNDRDPDCYVRILDNTGRLLMFEKLDSKSTSSTFDVSDFAPGLYQYQILQNSCQIGSGKFSIGR